MHRTGKPVGEVNRYEERNNLIEDINSSNIDEVLPLIRKYQEFYKVQNIDDKKNKIFFSQFGIESNKGCLFGYRKDNKLVAFTTIYFSYVSSSISRIAVMNDLYTLPEYRKQGIGKKLIQYCEKYSKTKGASRLQWLTAPDNTVAQSLYKSIGAKQSSWELFIYST